MNMLKDPKRDMVALNKITANLLKGDVRPEVAKQIARRWLKL